MIGWVGFVVTDFHPKGNKGTIEGHYVRVIWEGVLSESGGGSENFGVHSVQLVE